MSFDLSPEANKKLEEIIARYPQRQSAAMPAIYLVQEECGYIPDEALSWIASKVGLTPVHIKELVTFYTMYRREPLGKYHIQVCRTLSCAACGAKSLLDYVKARTGCNPRERSSDGVFSYEAVECLGSCGTAPMCQINDRFFENLTPERLGEIMDDIERESPDLSLSTKTERLGDGLPSRTKSEIM
jgi:NADH-quinone oxidoreductase subunit E